MRRFFNYSKTITILIVIYAVGIFGLSNQSIRPYFIDLTPFNLILTSFIVWSRTKTYNKKWFWTLFWSFTIGFVIEALGVHTGVLFGQYEYGATLGFKILDVPLIIGLNWYFLSYITYSISSRYSRNKTVRAIIAASVMVFLDFLIEPVAMYLDMWDWKDGIVPLQNYLMWWITAFVIQLILQKVNPRKSYRYSIAIFAIQFVFFLILNFTLSR